MNLLVTYRLVRYYRSRGIATIAAIKRAVSNQRQSNKYGVKP